MNKKIVRAAALEYGALKAPQVIAQPKVSLLN